MGFQLSVFHWVPLVTGKFFSNMWHIETTYYTLLCNIVHYQENNITTIFLINILFFFHNDITRIILFGGHTNISTKNIYIVNGRAKFVMMCLSPTNDVIAFAHPMGQNLVRLFLFAHSVCLALNLGKALA